jgi:hypothetical protein
MLSIALANALARPWRCSSPSPGRGLNSTTWRIIGAGLPSPAASDPGDGFASHRLAARLVAADRFAADLFVVDQFEDGQFLADCPAVASLA